MSEFEIKLNVPDESLAAVKAAVSRGDAGMLRLRARYFDTPDGRLAAARIALRVRQEGRRWVQTAKAAGDSVLHRLEEEAVLAAGEPPVPLIRRHAGTALGERLSHMLGGSGARADTKLVELYRTDVNRTIRMLKAGTTTLELALDVGWVAAGRRRSRVQELELELKSGSRAAAIELAQQWCERHGLWLDTVSKAERGQILAAGQQQRGPVRFEPPALNKRMDGSELLRAIVTSALDQVVGNASQVATGAHTPEHVHQLRIGLRRLRSVARELQGIEPFIEDADLEVLAQAFRALGTQRDLTFVQPQLIEQMRSEGAPPLDLAGPAVPDPAAVVRATALQSVLLRLLGWLAADASSHVQAKAAREAIAHRLHKLHARTVKDGAGFGSLPPLEQHALRKRFKRLRYLSDSVASLYPARQVARFIDELKPVQDALGALQDARMAADFWAGRAQREPHAWFAVGWLRAREAASLAACEAALARYTKRARPFWA